MQNVTTRNSAKRPARYPYGPLKGQQASLASRVSVAAQTPARVRAAKASAQCSLVVDPGLEPLETHFGIWLDNRREPELRLRVSIAKDGKSMGVLTINGLLYKGTRVEAKRSCQVGSRNGNVLDALCEEFGLGSMGTDGLLAELASRCDATDIRDWMQSANVVTSAITKSGRREQARFLETARIQVSSAMKRERQTQGLYLDESEVIASRENISPDLENIRRGLQAWALNDGSDLDVVDQARVADSHRAEHHQLLTRVRNMQVAAAAHRHVVGLPAATAEGVHGMGLDVREVGGAGLQHGSLVD